MQTIHTLKSIALAGLIALGLIVQTGQKTSKTLIVAGDCFCCASAGLEKTGGSADAVFSHTSDLVETPGNEISLYKAV